MKRTLLAVGVLVSALAGCGGSSSTPPTLTVGTVTSTNTLPGYPATLGRYLVEVPVALDNVGTTPISGWWYYYTLATKNELILSPSTLSNLVADPCSSDTTLAPGAKFQCTVVFDLPCGDSPVGLGYEGTTVTATINPTAVPMPANCGEAPDAGADGG